MSNALSILTSTVLSIVGVAALSVTGLAIAGVVAYTYSEFIDPITDSILLSLGGQDQIKLLDSEGNFEAGLVYDDGIPSTEVFAAHSMISYATNNGFDVLGKTVSIETGVFSGLEFEVRDTAIIDTIAARLDTTPETIFDSGNNSDFFGITAQGDSYMISAESYSSSLDQTLSLPLDFDGRTVSVDVGVVFHDGTQQWGDNLNGSSGYEMYLLDDVGDSYFTNNNPSPVLVIGGAGDDVVNLLGTIGASLLCSLSSYLLVREFLHRYLIPINIGDKIIGKLRRITQITTNGTHIGWL